MWRMDGEGRPGSTSPKHNVRMKYFGGASKKGERWVEAEGESARKHECHVRPWRRCCCERDPTIHTAPCRNDIYMAFRGGVRRVSYQTASQFLTLYCDLLTPDMSSQNPWGPLQTNNMTTLLKVPSAILQAQKHSVAALENRC